MIRVWQTPIYIENSFEFKYSGLKNDLCRKKFTIFYREYFAWQQIAQSYHFCRYECRYVSPIFAHSFPSHQNDGPQSKFPFSKSVFSKYALCFTFPPNSIKRWLQKKMMMNDNWQSQSTKVLTHHENWPIKTISTLTNNLFCYEFEIVLIRPTLWPWPISLVADSNIHHRFERCVCTSNFCWWIYHQKSPIRLLRAPF